MAKHFFAKLFLCEQKKRSGPACNAGGFLGTSLPTQRSALYTIICHIKKREVLHFSLFYAVLQACLLDAAEEEAHMISGVEQNSAPHAFVVLKYIDAGVVLLDLPKMFHAKA